MNGVHVLNVLDTEAEEVGQLSSGIDFGLPGVLALAEHGSGHELVAVLAGDKVGGLQEDSGAVGPRHLLPLGLGSESVVNGTGDNLGGSSVVGAEVVGVVVGHGLGLDVASLDLQDEHVTSDAAGRVRLTGLPLITQGTSKGSSDCIFLRAAWRPSR